MVSLNSDSGTTPCPECGKPMGLVTWTGEKPVCHRCSGATTTGTPVLRDTEPIDSNEEGCLHEGLSERRPDYLDGVHHIACPCPKCSPRV